MVLETELYNILDVAWNATTGEITRAYKKKALKCHPDKTNHDPELTEKFKEMTHAYEILRDKTTRGVYDAYGKAGIDGSYQEQQQQPSTTCRFRSQPQDPNRCNTNSFSTSHFTTTSTSGGFSSSSSVFSQIFSDINSMFAKTPGHHGSFQMFPGMGGPGMSMGMNMNMNPKANQQGFTNGFPQGAPNLKTVIEPVGTALDQDYARGQDIHHMCNATLADMYFGKTIKLQLPKNSKCAGCNGMGGYNPKTCRQCRGSGKIKTTITDHNSGFRHVTTGPCKPCSGSGIFINPQDKCQDCNYGYIKENKIIKVNVLPGSKHGDKIILQGEADEGRNIIPGDVVISLREIAHPFLVRKFNDLYMEYPIDLRTALVGGVVTIYDFVKQGQILKVFANVHGYSEINSCLDESIEYGQVVGTINTGEPKVVKGLGMPINEAVMGGEYIENLTEVDEVKDVVFDLKRYKRGDLFINFTVKLPDVNDFAGGKEDIQKLLSILPSYTCEFANGNAPTAVMEAHLGNLPEVCLKEFKREVKNNSELIYDGLSQLHQEAKKYNESPDKSTCTPPKDFPVENSSDFNYDDFDINDQLGGEETDDENYYNQAWTGEPGFDSRKKKRRRHGSVPQERQTTTLPI